MWALRKRLRVVTALISVIVLAGSIAAHATHTVHLPKYVKSVADSTDTCLLCVQPILAIVSTSFALPAPDYVPRLLPAIDEVSFISFGRYGVPTSRPPPNPDQRLLTVN
jgi:hypothetical protein